MTTSFRLFSLPFIPFKQVLDHFGPDGIIILSLCSQRSKIIVVSYSGPSKGVQLQLRYCKRIASLAYDSTDNLKVIDNKEVKDIVLPTLSNGYFQYVRFTMHDDCLVIFCEDIVTGLIEIGNHAREVFNQDIYEVKIGSKDAYDYRRLIEWTVETQDTVENFIYIEHEKTRDEDLDFILENVKCEYLSLSAIPSENYRPAKPIVCSFHHINISNSFWIKPEDLLGINSQIIKIEDSELTSQGFNVLLKHWMTGGWSHLSLLEIDVEEEINYETVFDGVEFIEQGQDVERVLKIEGDDTNYSMTGGADIKRPSDNITATINYDEPKHFVMIVWAEYADNTVS